MGFSMKKIVFAIIIMHSSANYPVNTILNVIGLACIIQGSSLNIPLIGRDRDIKLKKIAFGFTCLFISKLLRLMKKKTKQQYYPNQNYPEQDYPEQDYPKQKYEKELASLFYY